jgi:hypothetical protein
LGTITLSGAAPPSGAVVSLTSSVVAAGQVPPSVTIAGGATSGTFTVQTSPVSADSSVTISAAYLSVTKAVRLTVSAPDAAGMSLDPPSVNGGVSSTGTVTLTGPAPTGGRVVTLKSSNTVATFPAGSTVTVPAGATSAQFPVATIAVTANKSITITATAGGVSKAAVLTVTP